MKKLIALLTLTVILGSLLAVNAFAYVVAPLEASDEDEKVYDTNLPLGEISGKRKPAPDPSGKRKDIEEAVVEEVEVADDDEIIEEEAIVEEDEIIEDEVIIEEETIVEDEAIEEDEVVPAEEDEAIEEDEIAEEEAIVEEDEIIEEDEVVPAEEDEEVEYLYYIAINDMILGYLTADDLLANFAPDLYDADELPVIEWVTYDEEDVVTIASAELFVSINDAGIIEIIYNATTEDLEIEILPTEEAPTYYVAIFEGDEEFTEYDYAELFEQMFQIIGAFNESIGVEIAMPLVFTIITGDEETDVVIIIDVIVDEDEIEVADEVVIDEEVEVDEEIEEVEVDEVVEA